MSLDDQVADLSKAFREAERQALLSFAHYLERRGCLLEHDLRELVSDYQDSRKPTQAQLDEKVEPWHGQVLPEQNWIDQVNQIVERKLDGNH